MDAGQYYITTLTNAAMKLGPLFFYLLAGYFLFVKLPFLLYYRSIQKNKTLDDGQAGENIAASSKKKIQEEPKRESQERMGKKNPEDKSKESSSSSKDHAKNNANQKQSGKNASAQVKATPEEILFKLKPGQVFSAVELKKRYYSLLQENHPDKFRTDHQKEYAETRTKSINEAYQKLKKRVF